MKRKAVFKKNSEGGKNLKNRQMGFLPEKNFGKKFPVLGKLLTALKSFLNRKIFSTFFFGIFAPIFLCGF